MRPQHEELANIAALKLEKKQIQFIKKENIDAESENNARVL